VLTQWLSLRSLFYSHPRTRAHTYTYAYTYAHVLSAYVFILFSLSLSFTRFLSLSFRFYSLPFRLVYCSPPISFISFFPRCPSGRSAALTRRDPLRIIARPNRPNSLPLYWPLSDALRLPVHVEFQNKRQRLVVVVVVVVVIVVVVVALYTCRQFSTF